MLTPTELQKLTDLSKDYNEAVSQITKIKKLIHQLLNHNCESRLEFHLHNNDKCTGSTEPGQYPSGGIPTGIPGGYGEIWFPGIMIPLRLDPPPPPASSKTCSKTLQFQCTEATGIRILHALLQEKEEWRDLTLASWREIGAKLLTSPQAIETITYEE